MALKKRFTSLMRRPANEEPPPDADTPEANVVRGLRSFCESGGTNSGEEVLHLPTIVEGAVASPAAAQAACTQIRKFLSKDNYSRPHVQYNAVMLIRILADNPGESFTKNMDKQFADTVKHLLRNGQDPSVAQILRETLDALDRDKAHDNNLTTLLAMWRKEKSLMADAAKQFGPRTLNAPPWNGQPPPQGGYGSGPRSHSRTLPPPAELSGRIEEARTTAKLLLQLVQSTPTHELLTNDLVKEFSERCMTAQRSIQGYINCDNPPPDDDTMLTLIETNEQLSLAASKHQRAILQARRAQGMSSTPPLPARNPPHNSSMPGPPSTYTPPPVSAYAPPPQPPPRNESPAHPPVHPGVGVPNAPGPDATQKTDLPLPPPLQAGGGDARLQQRSSTEDDNPFADHYTSTYNPTPRTHGNDKDQGRQQTAETHPTMRGASPVSDAGRPRTPETSGNRQDNDVSPVAERTPITYRY
ncbi:uncharacterized protein EI97DRAFT_462450 [Westerdykella ornata]|uniref:GAT domain-containing protein n=1 Tax=Westerdykella ornata TaxID=318751 RepID=A0A6A6J5J3_WESOR|nr:uncharacterized protein EI97DRAFT_462450 [Westerdykella ornata]KAF2271860.1 hypothetical protein EI97DRAFT_462450 [Westerdykella ornata]